MRRLITFPIATLFASLVFFGNIAATQDASAQDDRLVGNWVLNNSPVPLPLNTVLTIEKNPDRFDAYLAFPIALPAPFSCKVPAGQNLIQLFPLAEPNYNAKFFSFEPGTCAKVEFQTSLLALAIDANGNTFTACDASALCLNWQRQGTAPGAISKLTVPPILSPVGGKASISTAFLALTGATGYRVSIKGPVSLARTVKKGLFTKFANLPKGNYKVSYVGFFKDTSGKVQSTKSSVVVKVKVT